MEVERLREAISAGLVLLGENRVQEAESKARQVPGASWHLIGPLQSNKVRRAVELFEAIQTVDSIELARRLSRLCGETGRVLPAYLQVNVDRDPGKAGFDPLELEAAVPELVGLANLRLVGLMSPEEARPTFGRLRELSGRLRLVVPQLGAGLSMGMSDDFEVAVEEGATVIRVGRAIFGERPRL